MATKLQIYNMALSAARGQGSLTSLMQRTRGREECDKWFDLVVDVTQEAAYWPCCKVLARFSADDRVDESENHEFLYSFPLPVNFLRPWYMDGFERFAIESKEVSNPDHDPNTPTDSDNPLTIFETRLYANVANPRLYYAQRVLETERWPPSMTQAFIYGLGYKVSEGLTGKGDLVERLLGLANGYLLQAQSISINHATEGRLLESDPSWIIARGAGTAPITRFYYPFGEVWTAVGGTPQTRNITSIGAAPPRIS